MEVIPEENSGSSEHRHLDIEHSKRQFDWRLISPNQRRSSFRYADAIFLWLTRIAASAIVVIIGLMIFELITGSMLSLKEFGFGFLTSADWNPVTGKFGGLSAIYGTGVTTLIAMVIAVPIGLVIALLLTELAPPKVSSVLSTCIELLAAVPSIIYGMWGLFVFAPYMAKHVEPFLVKHFGFLPLFKGTPIGIGILSAGIILAIMVLPYIASVTRDVFLMTPGVVKEAAYGIGATRWEVTRSVTLPYSLRGIVGACFLGLGRALGETMAVTFVIGNSHSITGSLLDSGNTIASSLANEFSEAYEPIYLSSLIELGLILLVITIVFQVAARIWLSGLGKRGL